MKSAKFFRFVCFIAAFALLLAAVPMTASAADSDYKYSLANKSGTKIMITGYTGDLSESGELVIPSEIDGLTVSAIASYAFSGLTDLTAVTIPASVETIQSNAFYGCYNIADVTIESADTSIAVGVFTNTYWYNNYPSDYIVIDSTLLLYYKGSDANVLLPIGVTTIGNGAFMNNDSIESISITSSITEIKSYAFYGCSNLSTINYAYEDMDITYGALCFTGTAWYDNFESEYVIIGDTLIGFKGTGTTAYVPTGVTTVNTYAFYNSSSNLEQVIVPYSVTEFGTNCFLLYTDSNGDAVYPEIVIYEDSPVQEYLDEEGIEYTVRNYPGDVDFDGSITLADARLTMRSALSIDGFYSDYAFDAADADGDGEVTTTDARMILRMALGVSEFTVVDLLSKPESTYDILLYVSDAVALAKATAGYNIVNYQKLKYDMSLNTRLYFDIFEDDITTESDAVTYVYEAGSENAYNKLAAFDLLYTEVVESATCSISGDTYVISITLADQTYTRDNAADTVLYASSIGETLATTYIENRIGSKYWNSDNFTYEVTVSAQYDIVVDIASGEIETLKYSISYYLVLTGTLMGITISDGDGNAATATRTDTFSYSYFDYLH